MTSELSISTLWRRQHRPGNRAGVVALLVLLLVTICGLIWLPPVYQNPGYHDFADQRAYGGIPNFWNVISNLPFLVIAAIGLRALRRGSFMESWERMAHAVLVLGGAAIAIGSGYYHWQPDSSTLFWDRLPMTLVFMSLLAVTIGERISLKAGRLLLGPLIGLGLISVLSWKLTGDLRLYGAVQFFPMLALPLLLMLCPPRYSGQRGIWLMIVLYAAAKLLELNDQVLAAYMPSGGHAWKHLAAAAALLAYVLTVDRRRIQEAVTRSA